MSISPIHCPDCGQKPTPMRRWHDKTNRVFNHLKYQVECERGCIRAVGHDRHEAVSIFNTVARHRYSERAAAKAAPPINPPRMTFRRLVRLIWSGARASA